MARLSYRAQRTQDYINRTYGYTGKLKYDEVGADYNAVSYFYDNLDNIEVNGFPFSSDYLLKDGTSCSQERSSTLTDAQKMGARLRYYYLPTRTSCT